LYIYQSTQPLLKMLSNMIFIMNVLEGAHVMFMDIGLSLINNIIMN